MTREQMQELLLQVWARTGKSVFFITHGLEEAVFLATHLIVMSPRPGRIVASLDLDFGRRVTAGADAGRVKSEPPFIEAREEVRRLIFAEGGANHE
jgi:taurine transport system ATP-binding protein